MMQIIRKTVIAIILAIVIFPVYTFSQQGLHHSLPADTKVKTERLSNGFTYFIRSNNSPSDRIELLLVVRAGSGNQDEDQIQIAHLVEHILYAKTKNFPNTKEFLGRWGIQIGRDANARTSIHETSYFVSLPTNNDLLLDSCLLLMSEIAQRTTLDSLILEREKGIIVQELSRNEGSVQRMMEQYVPWQLNYVSYLTRDGNSKNRKVAVKQATYEAANRFYNDWYRPNLQSLIVVGPVDENSMMQKLKKLFSFNDTFGKEPVNDTVTLFNRPRFLVVRDVEMTDTEIHLYHKRTGMKETSVSALKQVAMSKIYDKMIAARFSESGDIDTENSPSMFHQTILGGNLGNLNALYTVVIPQPGKIIENFKSCIYKLEQIRRFGFTAKEFDKAKQELSKLYIPGRQMSSQDLMYSYMKVLTGERANFDITARDSILKELTKQITLSELNTTIKKWFDDSNRDILILTGDQTQLPEENSFYKIIDEVKKQKVQAPKLLPAARTAPAILPPSSIPSNKNSNIRSVKELASIGASEIILTNGLKLIIKPTGLSGQMYINGFRLSGAGSVNTINYASVINAAEIVERSGAGTIKGTDVDWLENQKGISVRPYIYHNETGLRASGNSSDILSLTQLMYAFMTSPVVNQPGMEAWKAWKKREIVSSIASPRQYFQNKTNNIMGLTAIRKGEATASELDSITITDALAAYKQLFSHPQEYSFVITGEFDSAVVVPALSQYLGSIQQSLDVASKADSNEHCFTPNERNNIIYASSLDRISVNSIIKGRTTLNEQKLAHIGLLADIMQVILNKRLREKEGGTYGVTTSKHFNPNCPGQYEININFDCTPDKLDILLKAFWEEVALLKSGQIQDNIIETVKNQAYENEKMNLQNPGFWLNYLSTQLRSNRKEDELLRWPVYREELTKEVLSNLAKECLVASNYYQFLLKPKRNM